MAAHSIGHGADVDSALKRRLKVSIALTSIVFVAELAGGYLTGSLALSTDAAHVFMDVLALALSWFAIHISGMPPTETRTYGLHRVEVFVSFINSFVLIAVTLYIFYESYHRFMDPHPVESVGMMIVAVAGLAVNLFVALWLRHYAAADMNVRSAFIHVVGDAAASVGVIAGAAVIYFTGWRQADPLIGAGIGLVILVSSVRILADSSNILLEGVPKEVDFNGVVRDIKKEKGVASVHSLHVWSICHNVYALSAHVDIEPLERRRMGEIFDGINERLAENHHIFYTTLQAECSGCESNDVLRRLAHRERDHVH